MAASVVPATPPHPTAPSSLPIPSTTPPAAASTLCDPLLPNASSSSSYTPAETLLRQAAEHSLRAFLEPNAVFHAERLHAAFPSASSANLLATAYLRHGSYSQAADVLRPPTTDDNRYLYAVSQVRINTPAALQEAEAVLTYSSSTTPTTPTTPTTTATISHVPGGAAGFYLLATICQRTARRDDAIAFYRRAVAANPTLWSAVDALAFMGVLTQPDTLIPAMSDCAALARLHTQPQFHPGLLTTSHSHPPSHHPPVPTSSSNDDDDDLSIYVTPSPIPQRRPNRQHHHHPHHPHHLTTPPATTTNPPSLPIRHHQRHHNSNYPTTHTPRRIPRRSGSPASSMHAFRPARRTRALHVDDSSIRNPIDLFTTPTSTSIIPSSSPTTTRPVSSPLPNNVPSVPYSDASDALSLIRALATITAELGRFRCVRAIQLTDALPPAQRNTGLVLSLRGRAFLEKGDYFAAEKEFAHAMELEPCRLEGIAEYYSTVLWQLKKEKHLAALAIRVQKVSPVSAAAWCAAGNCFSLQRDGDAALQHFNRAIAVSRTPNAYAHTLRGHEYLAKEDFDMALASYREALQIDDRHYNAFYGIGQVLLKQEKFVLAQNHLRQAVQINPRNANLHYHLGVALSCGVCSSVGEGEAGRDGREGSGKHVGGALMGALSELETAINLDVRNPVPRFERAKTLAAMERLQEAREQLEELRDMLPKEAEVHFELSRVYRRLGDQVKALHSLSMALDLEPKERKYKKLLEGMSNELELPPDGFEKLL